MMFTATNGAYRRTKIVIDWINIGIGVAMIIMAIAIFLLPGNFDFLLPVVFFGGAVMNGLHVAKDIFKRERRIARYHVLFCLILAGLTVFSAMVVW